MGRGNNGAWQREGETMGTKKGKKREERGGKSSDLVEGKQCGRRKEEWSISDLQGVKQCDKRKESLNEK